MALICPYCRTTVEPDGSTTTCEGCGTPHHAECYAENGGCTVFGCKFAPPDDPKVAVTAGEVSQAVPLGANFPSTFSAPPTGFGDVNAPAAVAVALAEAPPPPPPPPGTELVPSAPVSAPGLSSVASTLLTAGERQPKSRLAFILLGIFLGSFGAHNFYAGYWKRGVAQLSVTVLTLFYASFVTWVWAVIEICTVDRDRNNVNFA